MIGTQGITEIRDIMETNVVTVRRDTPILEAIQTLITHGFTGLPVVDKKNRVVGIITEKDVLALALSIQDKSYDSTTSTSKVEDFMTTDVVAVDVNETLKQLCTNLMKHPFRRVPIVEKEKIIGIVSRKDIIAYIMHLKG
jgi:CBS domain-containing protein